MRRWGDGIMTVRRLLALTIGLVLAGSLPLPAARTADAPAAPRDGSHDFDFNIGTWRTQIRRVLDPLAGGTHAVTLEGKVTAHRLGGGPAQIEEIEADGPNGAHLEGMTLFLYDPAAGQWSQAFASSKARALSPPMIGAFKDGTGELIAPDMVDGRTVLRRAVWSSFTATTHHFEQDYSADGGRSWAPAFIADLTRIKD
jgi:hypothetical protein